MQRNTKLDYFMSIPVSVSSRFLPHSRIFTPSEQLVDVTLQRGGGLSHFIKVPRCDTGGLEGTEMVWSTSMCKPVISSLWSRAQADSKS